MSTLQEYISVIGCFQGILLFGLLIADTRMTTASRILGCLCLVIAFVFLMPFLLVNAHNIIVARLVGWIFFIPASAGALCYLFCRTALLNHALSARDLLLFVPWVLCYALTLDFVIGAPREMAEWASGAKAQTWRLQAGELLLFAQAFGYAFFTIRMIWQYGRCASDTLADYNPLVFRWLLILQVLTLVVWVFKGLPALTASPVFLSDLGNICLVLLVYMIAMMQWRNPQLFTIPSLSVEQHKKTRTSTKQTSGELDPQIRADLFTTVKEQMETKCLYLDHDLTLFSLAEATGLSKHHLSEVLNRHAGKNFYEFVNSYRVDYAKRRLVEDIAAKVLDIAIESGFSSKTTFNVIFKQFTGQTPTQYRAEGAINDQT